MLPKSISLVFRSSVQLVGEAFALGTHQEWAIGIAENAVPHILCALCWGHRERPEQRVDEWGGDTHHGVLCGSGEVGSDGAWVCVDKGEVWISLSVGLKS